MPADLARFCGGTGLFAMRQQLTTVVFESTKKIPASPRNSKIDNCYIQAILIDMNPKKPKTRKSRGAGISLEPDLIKVGRQFAEDNGFQNLSNLVRFLLTQELKKISGEQNFSLQQETGKEQSQPGQGTKNILKPYAGGCRPPAQPNKPSKSSAKSSK